MLWKQQQRQQTAIQSKRKDEETYKPKYSWIIYYILKFHLISFVKAKRPAKYTKDYALKKLIL